MPNPNKQPQPNQTTNSNSSPNIHPMNKLTASPKYNSQITPTLFLFDLKLIEIFHMVNSVKFSYVKGVRKNIEKILVNSWLDSTLAALFLNYHPNIGKMELKKVADKKQICWFALYKYIQSKKNIEEKMKKNMVSSFIELIWDIVSDPNSDHIISWSPNGTSFYINDQELFTSEILAKHFKHTNLSSFVRQLNMYNFHKNKSNTRQLEFFHKLFRRDAKEIIIGIRRKPSQADQRQGQQLLKQFLFQKHYPTTEPRSPKQSQPTQQDKPYEHTTSEPFSKKLSTQTQDSQQFLNHLNMNPNSNHNHNHTHTHNNQNNTQNHNLNLTHNFNYLSHNFHPFLPKLVMNIILIDKPCEDV